MLDALLKYFRPPVGGPQFELTPRWASTLQESLEKLSQQAPAPWVAELQESVQKLARGQAKQGARLESLESKVEAGFADLRSSASKPATSSTVAKPVDDLLDALDLLEAAARSAAALPGGQPVAEGLQGVAVRLQRQVELEGLTRLEPIGQPVDGRLFRVVGEAQVAELPEGVIAQVVRAAVLRGDQRIREGTVLINRSVTHE